MSSDPIIPRKWMLRAHGQHNVFVWGRQERSVHTVMKALLWALYLPAYPHMSVEVRTGDRYKPDIVAYAGDEIAPAAVQTIRQEPLFWGEAGQVGRDKIHTLVRRYKGTHFAIAKWDATLRPFVDLVEGALDGVPRSAPFDLISFPADSLTRFIDDDGSISIRLDDVAHVRL